MKSLDRNQGRGWIPTEFLPKAPRALRGPADDALMAFEAVALNEHRVGMNRVRSRSINVLIVDDDVSARTRVRNLLGAIDGGVVVREAAEGIAAVDNIKDDRPDLLVLDLVMPGLDGLGVLSQLRGWPDDLKPRFIVMVSTCTADPGLAAGVKLLGADAVYLKPLLHADVERILDSLSETPLPAA